MSDVKVTFSAETKDLEAGIARVGAVTEQMADQVEGLGSASATASSQSSQLAERLGATTAKLAVLKAELGDVNSKVQTMAKAILSLGNEGMTAFGAELSQLTTQQHKLQVEIAATEKSIHHMGGGFGSNRAAMMEFEHSIRAVMDGTLAGIDPIRMLEMELPRLVQGYTELSSATRAVVLPMIGVGVAIGGVAFAAVEMMAHAEHLDQVFNAMSLALEASGRGADYSRTGMVALVDTLRQATNVSTSQAEAMVTSMARMRQIGVGDYQALGQSAATYARVMGMEPPAALEKLTRAIEDGYRGILRLNEGFEFLSPAQAEAIRLAEDYGDKTKLAEIATGAFDAKTRELADSGITPAQHATNDLGIAFDDLLNSLGRTGIVTGMRDALAGLAEGIAQGLDPTRGLADKTDEQLQKMRDQAQAQVGGDLMSDDGASTLHFAAKLDAIDREIAKRKELNALKAAAPSGESDTAFLTRQLALTGQSRDMDAQRDVILGQISQKQRAQDIALTDTVAGQAESNRLHQDEIDLWGKLSDIRDQGAARQVQAWRNEAAQAVEAKGTEGEAAKRIEFEMLSAKLAAVDAGTSAVQKGTQAEIALRREVMELGSTLSREDQEAAKRAASEHVRAVNEWYQNYVAAIRDMMTAAKTSSSEQIALAQDWARVAAIVYGDDSHQFSEAQRAKTEASQRATEQLIRDAERQGQAAAEQARHAATMAQLQSKSSPDEFKVDAGDMLLGGASKLQAQIDQQTRVLTAGLAAEVASIKGELDAAAVALHAAQESGDTGSADTQLDRMAALDDRLKELQQKNANEIEALQQRAADATQAAWEKALTPIGNAFGSLLDGMITKRETFNQRMLQFGNQLLMAAVHEGEQELMHWAATEIAKTLATTTGNATRSASDQSANSGILSMIVNQIAQWLGLETSKTTAAGAGVAARIPIAFGDISIDASRAGAAAFADAAETGPQGLAAAPELAAAAYATTLGFAAGMGAFAVGTAGVPFDQLAMVHQGEIIVPARQSASIRAGQAMLGGMSFRQPGTPGLTGAPAAANANGPGDTHFHLTHAPTINGAGAGGQDLETMLRQQGRDAVKYLRNAHRNGAFR